MLQVLQHRCCVLQLRIISPAAANDFIELYPATAYVPMHGAGTASCPVMMCNASDFSVQVSPSPLWRSSTAKAVMLVFGRYLRK